MDKLPQRKNIRLKYYDYSQAGYYFVTICTKDRKKLFWDISGTTYHDVGAYHDVGVTFSRPLSTVTIGNNVGVTFSRPLSTVTIGNNVGVTFSRPLSQIGKIIDSEINKINSIYNNVFINKYVIMPNHVHMIIELHDELGRLKTAPTISRVIQQFKGSISKQAGFSIWQKSFHDHIIRNEQDYLAIYEYIDSNPVKWEEDEYYT